MDAYKQATLDPHGYLLLDLKQDTPEELRVLSHIIPFKGDNFDAGYYYIPKK